MNMTYIYANTRGHHYWFYFSVKNKSRHKVRLNFVNFTKDDSLYHQGMRVNIFSEHVFKSSATWILQPPCYEQDIFLASHIYAAPGGGHAGYNAAYANAELA